MVMVTYEEGLVNMGIQKPYHILRYSEPPAFEQTRQAYPQSSRANQAVPDSGTLGRDPSGLGGEVEPSTVRTGANGDSIDRERGRRRAREERDIEEIRAPPPASESNRTPRSARQKWGGGGVGNAGGDSDGGWLPSYYHSPEANKQKQYDLQSDLGYRRDGGDSGSGTSGKSKRQGWV